LTHSLKRIAADLTGAWKVTPASQALRWYGWLLRRAPAVLRTQKFYAADAGMNGVCEFKLFGRTLSFDADAINTSVVDPMRGTAYSFLRELFVRRIYFRGFNELKFDSCLDFGCNVGMVASLLRQLGGPDARVLAVDPLTYPNNTFRQALTKIKGLKIERHVLCDSATKADPKRVHELCDPYGFDPATVATIPEILQANQIDHVDFMKMDIEGAEFGIFAEPTPWLTRVDNIAMEVHSECGDPGVIVQHLQQHGFDVTWCHDYGYPVEARNAGYIYASRVGSLKH
jgi:FkbM family methyltransferase